MIEWMRTLPALSFVVLAALLPIAARAEEERFPGLVTLSDGTVLKGPIRTTRGKPLRLIEKEMSS